MSKKIISISCLLSLLSVSLCKEEWSCPEPPLVGNGEALVRWDGLMALYRCTVGFVLRGSPTISCSGNQWIGPTPYCIPEEMYAPPTHVFGNRAVRSSSPKEVPPQRYSVLRTLSGRHYQQEYNLPQDPRNPNPSSQERPLFQWDPVHPAGQKKEVSPDYHQNSRHYQATKRLDGTDPIEAPERPLNIRKVVVHANPQQDAPKASQGPAPEQPEQRKRQKKARRNGKKSKMNPDNGKGDIQKVLSTLTPPIQPGESIKASTGDLESPWREGNGTYRVTENVVRMVPGQNSFVAMPQGAIKFEELDMSCMQDDGDGHVYFLTPPAIDNGGVDFFRRRHHLLPDAPVNGTYLEAVYACNDQFSLRKDYEHSLYCVKGLWVGQIPVCVVPVPGNGPGEEKGLIDVGDPCLVDKGGCEHGCDSIAGSSVPVCLCFRGYTLREDNKTCADINECLTRNGDCQLSCWNMPGSHICYCPEGYSLSSDRKSCVDIDECEYPEISAGCGGRCINTVGSYQCGIGRPSQEDVGELRALEGRMMVCGPGHRVGDTGICVDVDECLDNNYGCSHRCVNTDGSAVCTCPEGLQLLEDWKTCDDVDECQQGNNGCSHICVNIQGSAYCACPEGFDLSPDERTCQDVDECAEETIACDHLCVNTPGSAHCSCPRGFTLASDEASCEDVNECLSGGEAKCSEMCLNTYGSYHCACPEGYTIGERDHTRCEDIDECRVDNGGCTGECRNTNGSHVCSCSTLYRLASDQRTCIAAACPSAAVPDGGEIICKGPRTSGRYAIGTTCEVRCGADAQLVGPSSMTCTAEGRWNFSGHSCLRVPETVEQLPLKMVCPPHITAELASGSHVRVNIPKPNFEPDGEVQPEVWITPSWAKGFVADFPPGTTIVTYATSMSVCSFKVTVVDKDPPTVEDCPEPFDAVLPEGATTTVVEWKEPKFKDNVGIDYFWKSKETGSEFPLGLHSVRYLVRDAAGNSAQCNFDINVKYGSQVPVAPSTAATNVEYQWNKLGCTYINSHKTDWLIKWPALQGCLNSPHTRMTSNNVRSSTAFNYQARGVIQEQYSHKVLTTGFGPSRDHGFPKTRPLHP